MQGFWIYDKPTLRQTAEKIFYRMRARCLWRGLPAPFEHWHAVYEQFTAWSLQEKRMGVFRA